LLDPPPRVLEDPAAVAVLGPGAEQSIKESAARSQTPESRALRAHMVLRSASNTPQGVAERAAEAGEPWLSFFEPEEMQQKLRGAGFTSVELLTSMVAKSRYFQAPCSLPTPVRTTIVAAVR
jgi:O-methyltransferase involved in polyketide biosynthesis